MFDLLLDSNPSNTEIMITTVSDLHHQDLEKLRLELHEICYQLDDAVETEIDTQHLEEKIAILRENLESMDERHGAVTGDAHAITGTKLPVTGFITLAPAPHGTTKLTLSVSSTTSTAGESYRALILSDPMCPLTSQARKTGLASAVCERVARNG